MKNCPKCGLANDVMRKYCRRCGASLSKTEEETAPEPIEELEDEPIAPTPSVSDDEPLVRPSDVATAYEEEPLVRPSAVASEQVEMETAEPEPIVMTDESPSFEEPVAEPIEEETTESSTMDYDRGKEVVADILEKVRAAEERQKAEMEAEPIEPDIEPPPVEPIEEEPLVYDEPELEPEPEEPVTVEEPEMREEHIPVEAPSVTTPSGPSLDDEIANDDKVRSLESDINAYNLELQQLRSEFDTLRGHLDEEVERYQTVAEVKRIRVESIERDLDLAKKEHKDADKEYKNVDNRRKKELSGAEKRINDVEKRLKKAEESKEKRIQDIEKELRKREEE